MIMPEKVMRYLTRQGANRRDARVSQSHAHRRCARATEASSAGVCLPDSWGEEMESFEG